MKRCAVLLMGLVLLFGCNGNSESEGITVEYLPTLTIMPDGSTTDQNIVGPKRIQISINPGEHQLQEDGGGVQVSFRQPDSAEAIGSATPDQTNENTFYFDLPDSEQLDICDYMYYRWTVVYENTTTSTNGTYIGEEFFVMPTTVINPDSSISNLLCSGP